MKHEDFMNMVNTAIDKFEQQGVFSRVENDPERKCYYLSENDGNSICCIVGHMMPDDEIRKNADRVINGPGIHSLFNIGFEWTLQFSIEQILLLKHLQKHHDSNVRIEIAVSKMKSTVEHYYEREKE